MSFVMSIHLSTCNLASNDVFSWNFIFQYFSKMSQKFKFHKNLARITPISHKGQCTFIIISCSVLLKMKNVSDKISREYQIHILWKATFSKNHTIYEIMWKNKVEPDKPPSTIQCKQCACWLTKDTNTHSLSLSDYVTLNSFPWQQCFCKSASMWSLHIHYQSCFSIGTISYLILIRKDDTDKRAQT